MIQHPRHPPLSAPVDCIPNFLSHFMYRSSDPLGTDGRTVRIASSKSLSKSPLTCCFTAAEHGQSSELHACAQSVRADGVMSTHSRLLLLLLRLSVCHARLLARSAVAARGDACAARTLVADTSSRRSGLISRSG